MDKNLTTVSRSRVSDIDWQIANMIACIVADQQGMLRHPHVAAGIWSFEKVVVEGSSERWHVFHEGMSRMCGTDDRRRSEGPQRHEMKLELSSISEERRLIRAGECVMQINWDSLGARLVMVVVGKAATRLSSVQCCHIGWLGVLAGETKWETQKMPYRWPVGE
jgi:hypothetical protein